MELNVGEQCTFALCKRLDFLPFLCDGCGQVFCKEHRTQDSHSCTHIAHPPKIQAEATVAPAFYLCSLPGCGRKEIAEIKCTLCSHTFCLHHRHQEDHGCPVLKGAMESPSLITPAPKKLEEGKANARKGAKSESCASKVALMKMKMNAQGASSIPQEDRIYYHVTLPEGDSLLTAALFFSKEWSVGKAVDFIAHKYNLRNENNVVTSKKLLLFAPDGRAFALQDVFLSLLDIAPSGSTLMLQYQ
ncbi:hypothetical protein EMCRGX_G031148 [Ephydatia muelleri]